MAVAVVRARARQLAVAVVLTLPLPLALALPARAQSGFADVCRAALTQPNLVDTQPGCLAGALGAAIAQPRLALAFAGGNPIPGSASTLGFRVGSPRVAAQLRASGAFLTLPPLNQSGNRSLLAPTLNADVAVGLLNGAAPLPTLSGVGSLDLVATLGIMPAAGGFHSAASFGAGVRLGVMRESFTVPGVTLSALLRRVGPSQFGESSDTVMFKLASPTDVSLRAVASKRFLSLATSAGVGLDHTSSDVAIQSTHVSGSGSSSNYAVGKLSQTRPDAFAALTWTSLVFTVTGELGWQKGGNGARVLESPSGGPPALPTGYEGLVGKSGLFGTLALRLTI